MDAVTSCETLYMQYELSSVWMNINSATLQHKEFIKFIIYLLFC